MTDATTFDPTPLTAPVDRKDVQASSAKLRRDGTISTNLVPIVLFSLGGAAFLVIVVPVFTAVASSAFSSGDSGPLPPLFGVFVLVLASFIVGAVVRGFGGAAESSRLSAPQQGRAQGRVSLRG